MPLNNTIQKYVYNLQNTWKCPICDTKGVGPRRGHQHYKNCLEKEKQMNLKVIHGFIQQVDENREKLAVIHGAFNKWCEQRRQQGREPY